MIKNLENISLKDNEYLMIERGWGKKVVEDTVVQRFIYDSDKYDVTGYLCYPKNIKGQLPPIIWNRGGDNKTGLLDNFLAHGILGEISSWGYVVLASQYRENDEFGGSDVNDVLNLINIIDSMDFCDSKKIGMEGWSRGGMMSYLVLTRTDRIPCSVIVSGLADLIRNEKLGYFKNNFLDKFRSKDEVLFKEQLLKRSAVYFADKINKNTSVLFIHGTADNKVSYQDSLDMFNKLKSLNKQGEYNLKLFDGGDHYIRNSRKEVSVLRNKWFDSYLKL